MSIRTGWASPRLPSKAWRFPINRYFLNHPEMVLGTWSRKDTLYGGEGYSVTGNGDLAGQLKASDRPPAGIRTAASIAGPGTNPPRLSRRRRRSATSAKAASSSATTGSFANPQGGQGVPVVYGGTTLRADGTLTGKRLAALVGLRDRARRVLQSQNEGWPEANRDEARRELNWAYDRFVGAYGPINKTTFGETADGSVIRRMPNLVKFREDPDAMLVMSLEDYDEVTGKAAKAAIMTKDVVGKTPPITHVRSAEEGLLVSLNQRGAVDLPFIAHALRQARSSRSSPSWATSSSATRSPEPGKPPTPISPAMSGPSSPPPSAPARICPQCRGPASRAARGRAARRHRRQSRRTVDTGERHPGLRRRSLPRRAVLGPGRPPEERCRLEPRADYAAKRRSPPRPSSARAAPTAPGCSSWPST